MTNRLSFQPWSVGEIYTTMSEKQEAERSTDKKAKRQFYQFVQPLKRFLMQAIIKPYKQLIVAQLICDGNHV